MTTFRQRFVGAHDLPKSLSEFDVEQSFQLSKADIEAIRSRFRTAGRLGAAVQLVVVRATGRPLERVTGLPRPLLRYLCDNLGLPETSLASLKTLYRRPATLFAHQAWARETSGASPADESVLTELAAVLSKLANSAASVDELVKESEVWLFDRDCLLPGDRVLRDLARAAFSAADAASLAIARAQVSAPQMDKVLTAVFSKRRGRGGGTVLEWLRSTVGKHSPSGLAEVTGKIAFLKQIGVHDWVLEGLASPRLRAYGQAVVNRPPAETRRLKSDSQAVEVVCFLRMTLLDLTDMALFMAARRISDLVRHAAARVQSKQTRGLTVYRECQEQIRAIVHDEAQPDDQKVATLKRLLPKSDNERRFSRAALVRQGLVDDAARVSALLNALVGLDIQGHIATASLKLIKTLRDLHQRSVKELPPDFDLASTDPVWQPLLADTLAELLFGIGALPAGRRKDMLAQALEGLLKLFRGRVLPFDAEAARRFADLAVMARAAGRGFPTSDGYIAAIAESRGFIVASRDTAPYEAAGLTVLNPWMRP